MNDFKEYKCDKKTGISTGKMSDLTKETIVREIMKYCPRKRQDDMLELTFGIYDRWDGIDAIAKCDERDDFDGEFARVLLARKLDYKQEERVVKAYKRILDRIIFGYSFFVELYVRHSHLLEKLKRQIEEMNEEKA